MECAGIFHYIEYKTSFREYTKNIVLILVFIVLCLTTSLVHNALRMISLSFLLPIFLSAIFANKKIIRFTFIISFIAYLISMVNGIYYTTQRSFMVYLDYVSGLLLVCAAYLIVKSVILYEQKTHRILKAFNLRQQEMIEEMKKDSLTQLYNHQTFYEALNEKIKGAMKDHKTLSLAILDIDDFKKVNDTYGHVKGDQVLVRLSELMKSYQSDSILLARYGGEEFCILFYDIDVKEAYRTLESMRLEFSHIVFYDIDEVRVTFSAGLVELKETTDNGTALVEKADQAMYEAKRAGKNMIVVYDKKKRIDIPDTIAYHKNNQT